MQFDIAMVSSIWEVTGDRVAALEIKDTGFRTTIAFFLLCFDRETKDFGTIAIRRSMFSDAFLSAGGRGTIDVTACCFDDPATSDGF